MYRFPDPLDEGALKGLMADKRFQDPRHPEHEFFKKFVTKAFEMVHPDAPRDGAGRAVIDPREPPEARVVRGGEEFVPDKGNSGLGDYESLLHGVGRASATGEARKPEADRQSRRSDRAIGFATPAPGEREEDDFGLGHFGAPRGSRLHNGSDQRAKVGDGIQAPVDGVVLAPTFDPYGGAKADPRKKGKLNGIQIEDNEGRIVELHYVKGRPNLKRGTVLKKGEVIGSAQDVAGMYEALSKADGKSEKMNNHVHIEVWVPKDPNRRTGGRSLSKDELREHYSPRDPWKLMEMDGRD
ncbi:MAG: hypothetical protein AB7M05_14960 [Alphaproteobacteria bacterium]